MNSHLIYFFFFFFNDTATTEIYTLSLHDALPILTSTTARRSPLPSTSRTPSERKFPAWSVQAQFTSRLMSRFSPEDRKSTRLNSSHDQISYAVFCLKKKKK